MVSWPSKFGPLLLTPLTRSVSTDPLPTLWRDTGQVIIFTSDISRNIYAYISHPVHLVVLGVITYILCSDDHLKWQSSSLHTNLSRLHTYFLYLTQKQTSQQHTFWTRFPLFFYAEKKKSTTQKYQVTRLKKNTTSSPRPIHAVSLWRRLRCNYREGAVSLTKLAFISAHNVGNILNFAFTTRCSEAGQMLLGELSIRCVASIFIRTVQRGHRYLRPSNSTTRFPFPIRVRD